jgi:peptidyl-prolyl cis-trans isomerase C
MTSRLLKDPLLHFLVFGALLFGAWFSLGKYEDDGGNSDQQIVIDQDQLDHLKALWKLQWKRDPAPADVAAIIDRYLRQEVFYREALKMNLDHNDEIIKKRLAQKMEAVANDLSKLIAPPTDERLRDYFHTRKDFFTLPPAYAFQQVLFLPEEKAASEATLTALRQGAGIPPERRNKLALPVAWSLTAVTDLDNAFGGNFVEALEELPAGQWLGPIRSGYGWHLVYIDDKQPARLPPFEEVRDFVAREYEYQSVLKAQDQVYESLLARYEVIITADTSPAAMPTELAAN